MDTGSPNSGYEGASFGRRTANWAPGNDSANSVLFGALETLRSRSREIARRNGWANQALDRFASELIGTGIKPKSQHSSESTRKKLHRTWLDWTDYADASGTQDFYGLQLQIARGVGEGGECFVRLRPRRDSDGFAVPLQMQVLEAEHCPVQMNERLPNGNIVRGGIEFDQIGARVAYWLHPEHPGEYFSGTRTEGNMPKRVPAFNPNGTANVLHIFRPSRPGAVRGEPWLSRALIRLNDFDRYTDAELQRKGMSALFMGWITGSPDGADVLGNVSETAPGGSTVGTENDYQSGVPEDVAFAGMEPGTIQELPDGKDIKFSDPADVGANFEPFIKSALREIAACVGMPYEMLTGDLTDVNFSSIRAGTLSFRRFLTYLQYAMIVFQLCRPLWLAWLEAAVLGGQISARDYNRAKIEFQRVKWLPDAWPWVDPEKDFQAAKGMVRNGFASRSSVVGQNGYDVEEVDAENRDDQLRAEGYGLVYDSNPKQTAGNGNRPAAPGGSSGASASSESGADGANQSIQ